MYDSIWDYSLRGYDILGWGLGQRWLSPRGPSQHKRGTEARRNWPLVVSPCCGLNRLENLRMKLDRRPLVT